MSGGGIYPGVEAARRALRTREAIPIANYRKWLNYERKERDSDNWENVGHAAEVVNLLNGHATAGKPEAVVAFWEWKLGATPLQKDEVHSRIYSGAQWEPELVVCSLAAYFTALERLRPLVEDRMMAWLGAFVPDTVDRAAREILEHWPERNGTAVLGVGKRLVAGGLNWIGMGDRSWVIDRQAKQGQKVERQYLDMNPVGQLLAIVLDHELARRVDVDLAASFKKRGLALWKPSLEARAACERAIAGDATALAEVFLWRNRCPHPYRHESVSGRAAGNQAWTIFPVGKGGSSAAGAAAYSTEAEDGWMSPLNGERSSGGGDDDVAPTRCEIRELATGRAAVAWRTDAPERQIVLALPQPPDLFRGRSGPFGHVVEIPAPNQPHQPPPTPPPGRDCGPRPEKPPFWKRWGKAAKRYRAELKAWQRCMKGEP